MTEEQKQNLLKQKAAIEEEISAIGQEEYDERNIASLYNDLGAVNAALGDYDEAVQCYNEGLSYLEYCFDEFDPYKDALYEGLKKIYVEKEDYKKAIEYAKMSSKNSMEYFSSDEEESFSYLLELCYLHLKAGEYSTAKIYLDRAARCDYSDDARLDYYYFGYYYAIEDFEKAIAYGEKAYKEFVEAYGANIDQAQYVKRELDIIRRNHQ